MISSEFTGYKISGSFVLFFPVKKALLCKSNYIQLFLNYELNRSASYGEAVCILTNLENESFAFENAQKLEFLLNRFKKQLLNVKSFLSTKAGRVISLAINHDILKKILWVLKHKSRENKLKNQVQEWHSKQYRFKSQ